MKKILFTLLLFILSISITHAQKKDDAKETIQVKIKDDVKPTVFVDGKKFDFPVDLIDQNKIQSVNVIKGKEALEKYDAPNGVILISTKEVIEADKTVFKVRDSKSKKPLVIIDGKVSDEESLQKLDKNDIEKIDVFKGEAAIKKYNAKNGVILITTKKKRKS